MREMSVFNDLVNGDLDGAIDSVRHRMDIYTGEDTYIGDVELGHSRGILASVVNQIASGSLLLTILTLIDTIMGASTTKAILLAILGFSLAAFFWLLVSNVFRVAYSRVFLEGRMYEKVPVSRFTFLYRVRKRTKAALSVGLYIFLLNLSMITVVLYPVLRYRWLLVPYLVAENPDLSPTEALRLSGRMMKGHKWEAFLLELSLLPWMLLSVVTGGLAGILFSNPYRESVFAEYHAGIRKLAIENRTEGCEKLTDRYLYELPSKAALDTAYEDIRELPDRSEEEGCREGVWGFLQNWFGVILSFDATEKGYRAGMFREMRKEEYRDAMAGKTYPTRLFPITEREKGKSEENVSHYRHYPVPSIILLFFIFCAFGWVWEVSLHLLQTGEFVNRGVLHGPWLPIYGGGCILILTLLYRFRKKPVGMFFLIILLCGAVEYFTSWLLEVLNDGQHWWDYTGYYLNVNGRICAEGLLVFGIGGMAFIYVLAPVIDNLLEKVSLKILGIVCAGLLIVFGADVIWSIMEPNAAEAPAAQQAQVTEQTEQR